MFCTKCQTELPDAANFCSQCATPTREEDRTTVISEQEPRKSSFGSLMASASQSISRASNSAASFAGKVAIQVGDLNGDGKVDEEDLKIAMANAKAAAAGTTAEVAKLGKEALHSDIVKDAAAGAAVGAVLAVPIPFVGPVFGGTIGGLLGAANALKKK